MLPLCWLYHIPQLGWIIYPKEGFPIVLVLFCKLNTIDRKPEWHLLHYFMMIYNNTFAWDISEDRHFREDFLPPVNIPVIPHKPLVQCNILIPPGLYKEPCKVVKQKLDARVFEPSMLLSICGRIGDTDGTLKRVPEHGKKWWIVMRCRVWSTGIV